MNRATDDLISRTEAKDFVRSERGAELLKHFPLNAIIVLKLLDEIPSINTYCPNCGAKMETKNE